MKLLIPQIMIAGLKLKQSHAFCFMLCISFLLVFANSSAQQLNVPTTVNKDTILIGEPLSMDIHVDIPLGEFRISWPDSSTYLNKFLFTNPNGPIDSSKNDSGMTITKRIYLTSFDSGTQVIPAIPIKIEDLANNSIQNAATDSIQVEVRYAPDDGVRPFHDIKSIIPAKNTPFGWPKYLIAVLFIALIIFLFINYKKKHKRTPEIISDNRSPYQEATEAIAQLKSEIATGNQDHKEYFSRLLVIFQRYLSRISNTSKMALTPIELINELHEQMENKELFTHTAGTISLIEAVLFAKFTTDKESLLSGVEQIKSAIDYFNKKGAK